MSRWDDDSDLRSLFAELRESDSELVPLFRRFLSESKVPIQPMRLALRFVRFAAVASLFLLLAAYVANRQEVRSDLNRPAGVSLSEWKAPTDFLLKTPGIELLQSVPKFGSSPGVPSADPNQTQE